MATVLDELLVRLGFDADVSGANRFDASLNNVLSTVGKVSAVVVGAGAVIGAALGKGFLDTAIQFENFETQLTTIEGSSEKAKKSLEWISEFGAKTPYDVAQVTDAFVKLKSYGLDPIEGDLLTSLGNTASAMGKSINDAVEMIADAVRGENERLKEFGIIGSKSKNEITYSYDINGESFQKTVANESKDIQAALQEIMDEKFRGGMEAMSKTWEGTVSNLGDTWTMMKKKIMDKGLFLKLKDSLNTVMMKIYDNRDAIEAWAEEIGEKLVVAFEWLKDTLFDVWDNILWVKKALEQLYDSLGLTGKGVNILIGLFALLAANIVGLAVVRTLVFIKALTNAFFLLFSPMALIGAALIAFILIVQDIYGYLNGKDSVIGLLIKDYPLLGAVFDFIVNNFNIILGLIATIAGAYLMMKAAAIAGFLLSMATGLASYALLAAGAIAAAIATAAAWIVAFAPFLLIAALVAAAIALFWVLFKNWDKIWQGIKNVASSVLDFIKGIIESIANMISSVWDKLKALFKWTPAGMVLQAVQMVKRKYSGDEGIEDANGMSRINGKSAFSQNTNSRPTISNDTAITQTINVASANEAAIVANNTNQAQRQRTYGYQ